MRIAFRRQNTVNISFCSPQVGIASFNLKVGCELRLITLTRRLIANFNYIYTLARAPHSSGSSYDTKYKNVNLRICIWEYSTPHERQPDQILVSHAIHKTD